MLAIFQSTLAASGERNSPERRGRPAGRLWSSLAFEPMILHAPTSVKLTFRMPIPLARDEMVTFSLPGFRRDGGSGFLSGGPDVQGLNASNSSNGTTPTLPAVDDDWRFVIVHPPRGIDRSACLQCVRHRCSVLLMFDSRSVRNVVGVMVTACVSCRVYWNSCSEKLFFTAKAAVPPGETVSLELARSVGIYIPRVGVTENSSRLVISTNAAAGALLGIPSPYAATVESSSPVGSFMDGPRFSFTPPRAATVSAIHISLTTGMNMSTGEILVIGAR